MNSNTKNSIVNLAEYGIALDSIAGFLNDRMYSDCHSFMIYNVNGKKAMAVSVEREFTSVAAAKKYMKQLNKLRPDNAYGEIVWIDRRTGDWEPLGDIELKGNNKTALVNNGKLTRSY